MSASEAARRVCALALVLLVVGGAVPPFAIGPVAAAGNSCTPISGQTEITSAGCYYLTDDIEPAVSSYTYAIRIAADDVVFDGQGYDINATNAGGFSDGIRIGDADQLVYSTTHLSNITVRDVTVRGWHEGGKVINSTVGVENVDFTDNTNGLVLQYAADSVVADTSFEGDKYALSLLRTPNTTLESVHIRGSDARPEIHSGLQIYASGHTTMRNSSVRDADPLPFYVQGPTLDRSTDHFVHDIDTSNTVDGKPIYYFTDETDLTIDAMTGVGFLGIANSTNVVVRNFQLSGMGQGLLIANSDSVLVEDIALTGNYYGLTLYGTTDATVRDSVFDSSGRFGIEATDVTGTTIDTVTVTNTDDPGHLDRAGIWVENGLYTTIRNSTIWDNENTGIGVTGNETTITGNDVKGSPTGDGIFTNGFGSAVTHNVIDYYQSGIDANAVNETIAFNRITTTGTGIHGDGDNTTVHSNVVSGAVEYGIEVRPDAVTIRNNTVTHSRWGVYVDNPDAEDAVSVVNNTLTDNERGVVLDSAEDVRVEANDVRGSTVWAFYADDDSLRAHVTELDVGYPLAFTGTDVALAPESRPPSDPAGYHNVSRFLAVQGTISDDAESWINASLPYDEADVSAAGVSESSLKLWFHNDTNGTWERLPNGTVDTAANAVRGNLTTIAEDASGVLAIMGDGSTPSIAVAPGSLDFGDVTNGTTATDQVTVTNTGGATLTVTGVSITGADASAFDVPMAGFTLAPSASKTLTVTFAPESTGIKDATLGVDSDDPATPTSSVSLGGNATVAATTDSGGADDGDDSDNGDDSDDTSASAGSSSPSRGSGSSAPPSTSVSVSSAAGVATGTVRNAVAGSPVDISLPYFPELDIAVTGLNVTTNTDRDYTVNVSHSDTPPGNADFEIGDGQAALGYLNVGHSVPDSEIDAVRFTFRVNKTKLAAAGIAPTDLTLHRNVGGTLTPLATTPIGEDATHWVFEADSPGLSVFVLTGQAAPATETSTPTQTVEPTPTSPDAGETTTPTATDTGTPTDTDGQPGFGPVVAVGALLVGVLLFRRRG